MLESVEAVGKNLLLRFEGGIVVRSHLRMTGRWRVEPRGKARAGLPWLVLRGDELEGVLWNGPVLTLEARNVRRLGQDVLAAEVDLDAVVARLRGARRPVARRGAPGSAARRRDREHVDGRGALGRSGVSPWLRVREAGDEVLRDAVAAARRLMQAGARDGPAGPPGVPARGQAVPPLRHDRALARAGRREPDRVLVPRLPGRRRHRRGSKQT